MRGLREVDAHDGPGRPEERFRAASGRRLCRCSRAGGRRATRSRRACWPRCGPSRRSGRGPQPGRVLDERIRALLEANAPALLGIEGCGTTTAAALVVAAGDNPGRLKGEAAFSMLCGVSPIPASSGKTSGTGSTAAATGRRTGRSTRSRSSAWRTTRGRGVRGEADLRGSPGGGDPLPEALHSAGGVPRAHGPESRRRRAGRPQLAKMRKAMRVTQKQAAAGLGLSAATLGHSERGNGGRRNWRGGITSSCANWRERSRKLPLDNL
ncbi:MAG: transposase [Collinsella aerofaciens]